MLQGYSASPTCTWTPSVAVQYLLSVTAEDATGTAVNTLLWDAVINNVSLTSVSVTAAPASPQSATTPITLTASASGGTDVQYQFWVYNPSATPAWSMLQGYSASPVCTWTPSVAGNYQISVTAQDGVLGTTVNSLSAYVIVAPLSAVSVTASPAAPGTANWPVLFTAVATGGLNVQYQFWLYDANATPAWSLLQNYSTQASCQWLFTTPGSYLLSVTACDMSNGMAANTLLWYTVDCRQIVSQGV